MRYFTKGHNAAWKGVVVLYDDHTYVWHSDGLDKPPRRPRAPLARALDVYLKEGLWAFSLAPELLVEEGL